MSKKTVAIIGTNGLPGRYGGWDQLLNHLTGNLKEKYKFYVYTSSHDAVKGVDTFNDAELPIVPLKANGVQSIPYDIISMIHAIIFRRDVLLILGTSGCVFLPVLKFFKIKTILNPDGAEWKRGKWSSFAKWFLSLSERVGIKYSDLVVADNKVIQDYIYSTYKITSELIEYGGDNAVRVQMRQETEIKYGVKARQYAFKVCRIVPENNIDLILAAFSESSFKLILIGNWNFSSYGKDIRSRYNKYLNLLLLDPIYDQKTLDELRSNCSLYVHGHSVGGTNPSLVEAMSLGLCCVVFDVNYNRETTENSAIYFSDKHDLKNILRDFERNEINLVEIESSMLRIAQARYRWDIITEKYSVFIDKI